MVRLSPHLTNLSDTPHIDLICPARTTPHGANAPSLRRGCGSPRRLRHFGAVVAATGVCVRAPFRMFVIAWLPSWHAYSNIW